MANPIRIKRRLTGDAGAPSSLLNAELAFNEVDDILYYGKGDNAGASTSRIAIAGPGHVVDKSTDQTIGGNKTFSNSPIIPTATAGDNSTKAASTAFVVTAIANAITAAVVYKGVVDASAADPAAAGVTGTPTNGWMYRVTTAGNVAFGAQLNVGDYVIYNGSAWNKIDSTDPSVTGTTDRVTVTPTGDTSYAVDIASTYAGQSSIVTLGTVTTGTWSATAIGLSKGGTNADLSSVTDGDILTVNTVESVKKVVAVNVIDGGIF